MSATIIAHPACLHSPQDVAALEYETGRKAVIFRAGIKLVPHDGIDAYDLVDRQSYLGAPGSFSEVAA